MADNNPRRRMPSARTRILALTAVALAAVAVGWRFWIGPPAGCARGSAWKAISPPETALHVRITGPNGKPVAGAQLNLLIGQKTVAKTSDSRGIALFSGPIQAKARLTVEARRYARKTLSISLGRDKRSISIALTQGAIIAGLILDDRAVAVAGAGLTFRRQDRGDAEPWLARSDAEGGFAIDTLEPGDYALEVQAADHERAVRRDLRAPLAEPVRIVLQRTGKLYGEVIDPTGKAAKGAQIVIAGSGTWPPRKTTSGNDGSFEFPGLAGGVYEVRASLDGAVSEPMEGVALEPGGSRSVELKLAPGLPLKAIILDAESEKPIQSAEITVGEDALSFLPITVKTGPDGRFEVQGLRNVRHRISIRATEYVPIVREECLPGAEEHRLAMTRAAVVAGTVVNEDGEAIVGAQIELNGAAETGGPIFMSANASALQQAFFENQVQVPLPSRPLDTLGVTQGPVPPITAAASLKNATTNESLTNLLSGFTSDAKGGFRIGGVPPGTVQATARIAGYAPAMSKPVNVRPGGTHEGLVLTLPRGGAIDGRVVDERGFPVPEVRVELRSEREATPRLQISAKDGTFQFAGVWSAVTVTAYPLGLPPTGTEILVSTRQHYPVELIVRSRVNTLNGRAVDERGFPIEGAAIKVLSLKPGSPITLLARSGADGSFSIPGLPDPPYKLTAEHPDFDPTFLPLVSSVIQEILVTFRLGVIVSGSVFDKWSQKPIMGARVSMAALKGAYREQAFSSQTGIFEYRNVIAGNYYIIFEKSEYISERMNISVKTESAGANRMVLEPIYMSPGGSVAGIVVDRYGVPVKNAEVAIGEPPVWKNTARTNAKGEFRLGGLTPGKIILSARHKDAGNATLDRDVRIFPLQETPGIVIRLPECFTIDTKTEATVSEKTNPIRLENVQRAVVVREVEPGSSEMASGIKKGDIIVAINGEPVFSASQAQGMLRSGSNAKIVIDVRRNGRPRRLELFRKVPRY